MVARLLGHSDLKMLTKIYDHTSTEGPVKIYAQIYLQAPAE